MLSPLTAKTHVARLFRSSTRATARSSSSLAYETGLVVPGER